MSHHLQPLHSSRQALTSPPSASQQQGQVTQQLLSAVKAGATAAPALLAGGRTLGCWQGALAELLDLQLGDACRQLQARQQAGRTQMLTNYSRNNVCY